MIEKLDKHLASNINSCNMSQNIMVAHKAIEKINELVEFCNDIGNARSFLERHEELITKLNDAVYEHGKDIVFLRRKLLEIKYKEPETKDIPDTEYVTITADDVLVGGKSATEYHGQRIYNLYHCPAYFKETRDIIRKENGCELLEIHCLQSSTEGKWLESGNPVADKNGENCWVRIKFKDMDGAERVSLWAFYAAYSSASECASHCTASCGDYVQRNSSLRAGLFGSVGAN